ncbi:transcription factor bHLH110 isoform X2 [Cucumis sativus]|uniref:transcription factor bHLH110 isoform X2 n=1 Tax=Cucumis sativus TaxID=3659 RepID=UPI0005EC3A11|nr:transcription factor bHLH110 isoform X2 [Cucumis sativus]
MDFSTNLHQQLLHLENQLLVGSGSGHAWTPDLSLSPNCEIEPIFHFQDLNPAIDIAQSFTSLQHYNSHGISKERRYEDQEGKREEKKDSSSSNSLKKINDNESLKSHDYYYYYHSSNFEEEDDQMKKIGQSCCCSKIHPTVNVSSRNSYKPLMTTEFSSSLGLFDHSFSFASSHHLLDQSTTSSSLLTKMGNHEITNAKRAYSLKQQKQSPNKKTRVEPRPTCPPLKIRKEKLGDRIAALQQLVAPFGKTDTASVLMEAISYINFLQNQMLSHSYMKSCRSKNYKTTRRDELNDDKKQESDLKAKGLCLVPLACISYLPEDSTNGGRIGSLWPPLAAANFNRRSF